jgi:hypothetical protein
MLKNYIRTAFRSYSLRKKIGSRPFFTYINLLGLIIGLAAFLVIAHMVRYEVSFDKHISNNSSLYRVTVERKEDGQTTMASARTYPGRGILFEEWNCRSGKFCPHAQGINFLKSFLLTDTEKFFAYTWHRMNPLNTKKKSIMRYMRSIKCEAFESINFPWKTANTILM